MSTATVILSGSTRLVSNHNEFTTTFIPPPNCSGRSCYLKVTNVAAMSSAGTSLAQFSTFFVTADIPQPFSYGSINNMILPAPPAPIPDGRLLERDNRNSVIAILTTGGVGLEAGGLSGGFDQGIQSCFPRILVEIPDGPHYVTIALYNAIGNQGTAMDQLTVMFELTPIDSEYDPQLSI